MKIEIKKIKQTKTKQNEVRVKLTLKRKDSKRLNVSFAILAAPEDIKTESFYEKVFLSILRWCYVRSDMCFAGCSFHFCLQSPGQSPAEHTSLVRLKCGARGRSAAQEGCTAECVL